MEDKSTVHLRRDQELNPPRPGHDPLQNVRDQTGNFNATWLKHGECMPRVQRAGFIALSLTSIAVGLFIFSGAWDNLREGNLVFVPFYAVAALFSTILGILGLRNALRFKGRTADR
jgi:hypothetical protein